MTAARDPEEFAHKFFKKTGFSLPIEIVCTEHEGEEQIKTWHVRPQSWLQYLLSSSPELLSGHADVKRQFLCFWQAFRLGNPDHAIFSSHLVNCLDHCVPLLLHGDEGRSMKKGKCMIMSIQSILGSVPKPKSRSSCDCAEILQQHPNLPVFGMQGDASDAYSLSSTDRVFLKNQNTNYRGSSFLSRFLLFSLGSWIYQKHPEVMETLLGKLTDDLASLFFRGLLVGTDCWFAAVIAIKGDMAFHRQTYLLTRSYANAGTKFTGAICHMCEAGGQGPMFEDYSESPCWETTCFRSRPWDPEHGDPTLARVPGYSAPERLLEPDPFHVVKMGVGRSIAGGILVYLVRHTFFDYEGCDGFSFKVRLERAHSSFALFCKAEKRYPSLRSFTKAFLNMKNLASAPWTNTKGADTLHMLRWLYFLLALHFTTPGDCRQQCNADPAILQKMMKLCKACIDMFHSVHSHTLWMERSCARRLYVEIMRVLRGYQLLGSLCLRARYRAFIQKPKNHALHHIAWKLRQQLASGAPLVLNPEAMSCEQDEDYIGRIARLSRKVDVRRQGERVFQRLFLKIKAVRRRRRTGKA